MREEDIELWDSMQKTAKEQGYDSLSSLIAGALRRSIESHMVSIKWIEVDTEDAKGWDIRKGFYGRWLTDPLPDPEDPYDPDFDLDAEDMTFYQVAQTEKGNIIIYSFIDDTEGTVYFKGLDIFASIQDALDAKAAPEWVLNQAASKLNEKIVVRLAI